LLQCVIWLVQFLTLFPLFSNYSLLYTHNPSRLIFKIGGSGYLLGGVALFVDLYAKKDRGLTNRYVFYQAISAFVTPSQSVYSTNTNTFDDIESQLDRRSQFAKKERQITFGSYVFTLDEDDFSSDEDENEPHDPSKEQTFGTDSGYTYAISDDESSSDESGDEKKTTSSLSSQNQLESTGDDASSLPVEKSLGNTYGIYFNRKTGDEIDQIAEDDDTDDGTNEKKWDDKKTEMASNQGNRRESVSNRSGSFSNRKALAVSNKKGSVSLQSENASEKIAEDDVADYKKNLKNRNGKLIEVTSENESILGLFPLQSDIFTHQIVEGDDDTEDTSISMNGDIKKPLNQKNRSGSFSLQSENSSEKITEGDVVDNKKSLKNKKKTSNQANIKRGASFQSYNPFWKIIEDTFVDDKKNEMNLNDQDTEMISNQNIRRASLNGRRGSLNGRRGSLNSRRGSLMNKRKVLSNSRRLSL